MSLVKYAQQSSHSALCCHTCPLSRVWCLPVVSRVRCLRSVCPAKDSQINFCFFWRKGKWCPHKVISCVHGGQPTVNFRVSASLSQYAWICAPRATDRDLESVSASF